MTTPATSSAPVTQTSDLDKVKTEAAKVGSDIKTDAGDAEDDAKKDAPKVESTLKSAAKKVESGVDATVKKAKEWVSSGATMTQLGSAVALTLYSLA